MLIRVWRATVSPERSLHTRFGFITVLPTPAALPMPPVMAALNVGLGVLILSGLAARFSISEKRRRGFTRTGKLQDRRLCWRAPFHGCNTDG